MKTKIYSFYVTTMAFLMLLLFGCKLEVATDNTNANEKNAKRFFGIHYDMHVKKGFKDMGKNLDEERVERFLSKVKPDYVHISCKGHPGYAAFPTKVQEGPENFIKDPLKIWRELTNKHDVDMYMHFSGVLDDWVVNKHPDWAALDANGNRYNPENIYFSPTSIFSPYVDTYFLPMVKELIDNYQVDGAWFDGDCWGMTWDYSPMAIKKFKEKTGLSVVPKSMDDPNFQVFADFCRSEFRDYVRYYSKEIHNYDPNFKVINSGVYSARMPEFSELGLDYLSVDEPTTLVRRHNIMTREPSTINFCRFDGRVFANQDIPWDLMVWGFYRRAHRTANQLKQDAAIIHAMGGGVLHYFQQKEDYAIQESSIPIIEEISEFSREREPYCYLAKSIPQIGLVMPTQSVYRLIQRPFELDDVGELRFVKGLLFGMVEAQQVVDVVLMDTLFKIDPASYPLMVLPNWKFMLDEQKAALIDYAQNGGNLLIIGPHAADMFKKELNIEWKEEVSEQSVGVPVGIQVTEYRTWTRLPKTSENAKILLDCYPNYQHNTFQKEDYNEFKEVAASVVSYGKGKIGACYIDLGSDYYLFRSSYTRSILKFLIKEMFPNPMVEVTGSDYVDVTLNKVNGKTALHLVNTAGPHAQRDVYIYDDIPAVGPLSIKLRLESKPKALVLQPSGKKLKFTYKEGIASFSIDRLDIYVIIIVKK